MTFPRAAVYSAYREAISTNPVPAWADWLKRHGGIMWGDGWDLRPDNGLYAVHRVEQPPYGYPVTAVGEPREVYL